MHNTRVILSIIFLIFVKNIIAQKNDYQWPMGYQALQKDSTLWTETYLRKWGFYNLDFTGDYPKVVRTNDRRIAIETTSGMYCTDEGILRYMTNGQYVEDSTHVFLEKIGNNRPYYWDLFLGIGFNTAQGTMILPWPDKDSVAVFVNIARIDTFFSDLTSYTIINNKSTKAELIDEPLQTGEYKNGRITATRHGNGRDWWLIKPLYDGRGYEVYIFDKEGVRYHQQQSFGEPHYGNTWGGAAFSPDGNYYGSIDMKVWDSTTVINVFDFDRCEGTLSNFRTDTIANYEGSLGAGISFSPNSRYMYTSNRFSIYQHNTNTDSTTFEASKRIVAEYDGFINDPSWAVQTTFGPFANGPDGRLYNFTSQGGSIWLHTIDYPNEVGLECDVRQHSIPVHYQSRSAPNFPNYRLGPLDGSSCDTLGLDNHPIAKYRYEPDTIDYKRIRFTDLSYFRPETWSWDFGDNSPKISQRSPYHTYTQNGTYKVCLTVSNENSSNTSCRNITIGTSATDNDLSTIADVTLYPNPVQDNLLVTIGDYIPERGYIEIYNLSGQQIHKQRAYYGHNNVDMSAMVGGTYVLRVVDGDALVKEVKVVKI
jgi:hypothetical protein